MANSSDQSKTELKLQQPNTVVESDKSKTEVQSQQSNTLVESDEFKTELKSQQPNTSIEIQKESITEFKSQPPNTLTEVKKNPSPIDIKTHHKATVEITIKQLNTLFKNHTYQEIEGDKFIKNKTTFIDRGRLISEIFIIGVIEQMKIIDKWILLTVNDYTGTITIKIPKYNKHLYNKIKNIKKMKKKWYRFFGQLSINTENVEILLFNYWNIDNMSDIYFFG